MDPLQSCAIVAATIKPSLCLNQVSQRLIFNRDFQFEIRKLCVPNPKNL